MNITLLELYAGLVAATAWARTRQDPRYTPTELAADAFTLAEALVAEAEKRAKG